MSDDWKESLLSKLIDSVPVLVLLLGVIFVALGLAKVKYLPIEEPTAKVAAVIFGICIFATGLWLWRGHTVLPKAKPYGIKIQSPAAGAWVHVVDVSGSMEKATLPENYSLRVFRMYPEGGFIPMGEAHIDAETLTWKAERCDIAGKPRNQRSIAVFLVGPAGAALLDYHVKATQTHRATLEQLKQCGKTGDYLPPIAKLTPDMIECHRISVWRDDS